MVGKVPTIRAALHDAIEARQLASGYIVNTFALAEAARKTFDLEELQTPRVTLIGAGFDERPLTRKPTGQSARKRSEIPIYVFLQQQLAIPETAGAGSLGDVDALLVLLEELMETASSLDLGGYTWTANEILRDANGLPYDFHKLHETSSFEASFAAKFEHLPPN
jgi:hypothetical protein